MQQVSKLCKNCDHALTGKFCSNCGQKANIHRIDLKHLIHEFFHALTHFDRGFFYTAKEMIIRPGNAIREYLEGKRISHPSPIVMLLIVGGLCSLVYYQFELKLITLFKISELDAGFKGIDSKFFAALYIVYSLIFSLCDSIIFRYKNYRFGEYFILNVFISNQVCLFQICLVPLWLVGREYGINNYFRILIGIGYIVYFIFVRYQFFEVKNDNLSKRKLILEGIVFFLLFFAFSWKTISQFL
ncbi:MAG: DUF3667 domain-containing protein [bacterium]|nr:DUF3667 domain-containing protein [bacterium]